MTPAVSTYQSYELAEDTRAGAEKIITQNGQACIAISDAKRLANYPVLYMQVDDTHFLLSIKHHKQLSFNFEGR